MSGERAEMTPRVHIPETDGSVTTRGCEGRAIRTKRYIPDPIRMSPERAKWTTGVGIPQTGGVVITPAGDDRPIGTKR